MSTTAQLLIAGGGIGGLAAALAAARTGCQVRLLERAPEFTEVGAGIQLGPNVTRILRDWGLGDALCEVAAFPERLQVRCALRGDLLGELALGEAATLRYGAPYATIHRADMHHLLHRAVVQQGGVALERDQWVAGYAEEHAGVRVHTLRGRELAAEALIGADGVWSRVREQMLNDGPPRVTGHLAYRAMLEQAALPPTLRTRQVTAWLGPRLHLVQYPVRGGDWMNVVAIVHGAPPAHPEDWDHHANAADLERAMGFTCPALRDLIGMAPGASINAHAWRLWALADRPPVSGAQQLARGRVALLGDAAHPMRPYLAQGAGMAIEDASILARTLAMDTVDMPTRLTRYALTRWQRVAQVQARSIRNGHIYHATGLLRGARDMALRLAGRRLMTQRWLYGS